MSEDGTGYRFPGDIEVIKCAFVTFNGEVYDVSPIVDQINIYQSMKSHYLEADFLVLDSGKFLHALPDYRDLELTGGFTGTESMIVEYRNRSVDDNETIYTHTFRLYSLKDIQSFRESETYLISGISEEGFQTFQQTVSRSYGGKQGRSATEMMESVFKEYFKSPMINEYYQSLNEVTYNRIDKQLSTSESQGNFQFIIPNLSVDDTIRYIASEADSASHVSSFYFYEDTEGFNFKNVNDLATQQPFEYFQYSINNTGRGGDNDFYDDTTSIIKYRVIRSKDFMDNVAGGLYHSKRLLLDLERKRFNTRDYVYSDWSKKFNKLQDKLIPGQLQNTPDLSMVSTRQGHDTDAAFADEGPLPKASPTLSPVRRQYNAHIFNQQMEIQIPGNPDIKVGQVIDLVFPVNTFEFEGIEEHDKYLSGSYLITKVKLTLGKTVALTTIQCSKDGGI